MSETVRDQGQPLTPPSERRSANTNPPPDESPPVSQTKPGRPELSREPIMIVDAAPDARYPLRILRAYRVNGTALYQCQGMSEATMAVYHQMNSAQLDRQRILDDAIAQLERAEALE